MRELPGKPFDPSEIDTAEFDLSDYPVAIGKLNDERKRREVKLIDLEEHSGVSMNTMYAWQSGFRSPTLVHLCALAKSMGFEVVMKRSKQSQDTQKRNASNGTRNR